MAPGSVHFQSLCYVPLSLSKCKPPDMCQFIPRTREFFSLLFSLGQPPALSRTPYCYLRVLHKWNCLWSKVTDRQKDKKKRGIVLILFTDPRDPSSGSSCLKNEVSCRILVAWELLRCSCVAGLLSEHGWESRTEKKNKPELPPFLCSSPAFRGSFF